ncbi:MAG: hypothetical protein WCV99_18800 [Sterolibacterium sp.]|jgi:hypothetical protein
MRKYLAVIGLLGLVVTSSNAANTTNSTNSQPESCDQIRALINAKTGIPVTADTGLLQKLARPECRFSAIEVYRAAYGDKPMPKNRYLTLDGRRDHDDDDD